MSGPGTTPSLSDAGNAERFAAANSWRLRFVHRVNRWHVWDGRRWALDETNEAMRLALVTVRAIRDEADAAPTEAERRTIGRHALVSESTRALKNLLEAASSVASVATKQDDLDCNPWLLNCENGTLDLRQKSCRLYPHNSEDLITKLAPVTYDAEAKCPTWDAFLARVTGGNGRLQQFIQRAIGYSLTADVGEHALFLLYGSGANGKSTLLETLLAILGDYAKTAAPGLLMRTREGRHEEQIAELKGVRFCTGQESGVDQALDEPKLKYLTGGDTVSARRMYADRIEFAPSHKFWIATNHKPRIRGGDDGIWRRMKLIPFEQVIAEHERDPRLKEKLRAEAPGILSWAVQGCLAWQQDGLGVPDEVRDATASYRASEDQLVHFLEEACIVSLTASCPWSQLYETYQSWAGAAGERPMSQPALGEALEARGFEKKRIRSGRIWVGVAPRGEFGVAVSAGAGISDNSSMPPRERGCPN
jgi:putative DNA primase/helicase